MRAVVPEAIAIPASVSVADRNFSIAGTLLATDSDSTFTVDGTSGIMNAVITDIILSIENHDDYGDYCWGNVRYTLTNDDGDTLAIFAVGVPGYYKLTLGSTQYGVSLPNGPTIVPIHFESGLVLAPGETLSIETIPSANMSTACDGSSSAPFVKANYTLSGYYAP